MSPRTLVPFSGRGPDRGGELLSASRTIFPVNGRETKLGDRRGLEKSMRTRAGYLSSQSMFFAKSNQRTRAWEPRRSRDERDHRLTSVACPINIAHSTERPSMLCGSRWKSPRNHSRNGLLDPCSGRLARSTPKFSGSGLPFFGRPGRGGLTSVARVRPGDSWRTAHAQGLDC
jgi:hypothetical protein